VRADARWVVCRWCWDEFIVCRSCDHGRAYCEDEGCRRGARHEANDRHQRSDEGREDHRDRMIERRKKEKTRGVDDKNNVLVVDEHTSFGTLLPHAYPLDQVKSVYFHDETWHIILDAP
jgi:hypothetical protein